jgi:hypothetical protein
MREYNVEPHHTYNMDEKGFFIGLLTRSKCAFSWQVWESKQVRDALQDGSGDFVALLMCICANGTALEPSIIFEEKGLFLECLGRDCRPSTSPSFYDTSPDRWSNNDVGMA